MLFYFFPLTVLSFRIRLYSDSKYIGLPRGDFESPTMMPLSLSDRFETEFIEPDSRESIIRVKNTANKVLTASKDHNSRLMYRGKHGGPSQRWKIIHGRANSVKLKSENLCLEYRPDQRILNLEVCSATDYQLFNLIEDDEEDHGLATQTGITCNKRKNDHGMRD